MDMETTSAFRKSILLSVGSIVVFGLLVYLNVLGNDFVFDDHPMIEEREIILHPSLSSIKDVLMKHYRPIRDLALMLISSIGGPHPVSFHLANVLIHLLNASMVYAITLNLTQSIRIAILTSLLFTIHPIQTDAVTYVSGIRDTLSTLFVLMGLYYYMEYRKKKGMLRLAVVMVMLIMGLGVKEMAVGLVALIVLYDLQYKGGVRTGKLFKTFLTSISDILRRSPFVYLLMGLFILVALVFYLALHHASVRIQQNEIYWWGGSILFNYMTVPKLWISYLIKLIFPHPLIADYMGYPIVADHPLEFSAWLSIFMLVALFCMTFKWLMDHPVWGFALGWILVTLLPVVQIFPHHELMAEHHLYLPSVGFSLLVALGIDSMMNQHHVKWAAVLMTIGIVVIYSFKTVSRNMEWQNDLTLFQANLRDFPNAPRSYMQIGNFYQRHNMFISAQKAYEQALSIKPDFTMAHNNFGVLYYQAGRSDKAIGEYEKALHGPLGAYVPAYTNLGRAYLVSGRTQEGIQALLKGLSLSPGNHELMAGLYYAYRDSGDEAKAEGYLRQWLKLRPDDPDALMELANKEKQRLNLTKAINIYDRILNVSPSEPRAHKQRSLLLEIQQEMEKIQVRMKSNIASSEDFLELAGYYRTLGIIEKAHEVLVDALARFPKDPHIFYAFLELVIQEKRYHKDDLEHVIQLGKHYKNNFQISLLIAQALVQHQRIEDAYQLLKYTLSEYPISQLLESNIFPSSETASKCDQSRILAKVFDGNGFVETAYSVLKNQECDRFELEGMYLERARLSVRLNKINIAIDDYGEVLKMNPKSAQAQAELGFIMLKHIGDFESAVIYFNESLRLESHQRGSEQMQAIRTVLEESINSIRVRHTPMNQSMVSLKIAQLIAEYNALSH